MGSHKGVYIFVVSIYRSSGGRSGRKNDGSERDDEKDRIMTHIVVVKSCYKFWTNKKTRNPESNFLMLVFLSTRYVLGSSGPPNLLR